LSASPLETSNVAASFQTGIGSASNSAATASSKWLNGKEACFGVMLSFNPCGDRER